VPAEEALAICKQIAEALEAAAREGHHAPRPEAGQREGDAKITRPYVFESRAS